MRSIQHFTLAEANALLPFIRGRMAEILEIREWLLRVRAQMEEVWDRAEANAGGRLATQVALKELRIEELVGEINATGAQVKDINLGLVDFPTLYEGREVLFCWQFGEPSIRYWHGTLDGYAGRQPIDELW